MGLTNVLIELRDHIANTLNVHGATNDKTPNKLMARDAAGRSKATDPSAADDIATKGYADGIVATETQARINADAALQTSINSVSAALDSETQARQAAVNDLQAQIVSNNIRAGVFTAPSYTAPWPLREAYYDIPGATNGKVLWWLQTTQHYSEPGGSAETTVTVTTGTTARVNMATGAANSTYEYLGNYLIFG